MHDGYDNLNDLLAQEQRPEAQRKALKQRAIALLARRDHSRAELARKLLAGPPPLRRRRNPAMQGQGGRRRSSSEGADAPTSTVHASPDDDVSPARHSSLRADGVSSLIPRADDDHRAAQHRPSAELVESVLDELVSLKFLSDERMAESLVRSASARFGSARLAQDMQRKGLAEGLVAEVLAPLADTEQERAQEIWNRRFGKAPVDMKERARQYRFLMSRGFSARVVSAVVPRVTGGAQTDDDEFPD
ncbi:MAG: regulatory protein RecX [Lautropia sp.]|nr:regulatory protein RecX [Lautropia sp.]